MRMLGGAWLCFALGLGSAGCAAGESIGPGDGAGDGRPRCISSADCDDRDSCTNDICQNGTCMHTNSCCTSNADCDDHRACTDDVCQGGGCKNTLRPGCCASDSDCDDMNACTQDHCDDALQMCTHTMIAGCCTSDMQCDDGMVCTQDACMNRTCQHTPVMGCCTADAACDDGNPCTSDTCNTSAHVCMHMAITPCCTSDGMCDDGNSCTTDACNLGTHQCTHMPMAGCCNADPDCNDNNACTTDACNVSHQCVHNPVEGCCNVASECDDGNSCTSDSCNTATHMCVHTGVPGCCTASSQCDDRNVCNGVETCVGGTCQMGMALSCNDGNACTLDLCDPLLGCQDPAVSCDDGNACTTDSCSPASGCQHAAVNCDDGDICTTDGCNFTTGCTHAAIPACTARPNDLCANAIDVSGGNMTVTGSTLGAHDEVNPPAGCVGGSPAANGGPDVFYRITIPQTEWVFLDTFGSAINTVVYVLDACGGNVLFSGQACGDDSGCNPPDAQASFVAVHLTPGTYFIVVDSFGAGGAGAFNLHITHGGPTCQSAQFVGVPSSTPGNTSSGTNLLTPSCVSSGSGPENMYMFFLCPFAGTFQVEGKTCGTSTDTVVYLRQDSCTGGDVGCNDDSLTCGLFSLASDAISSSVSRSSGLFYVIVDTYPTASPGPYTLQVSFR